MNLRHFTNGLKFHSQALTGELPSSFVCNQERNCLCRPQQSQQNPTQSQTTGDTSLPSNRFTPVRLPGAQPACHHTASASSKTPLPQVSFLFLWFTHKPIKTSWWKGCSGNRSPRNPFLLSLKVSSSHPGELWTPVAAAPSLPLTGFSLKYFRVVPSYFRPHSYL